jgi:hypothetical protein
MVPEKSSAGPLAAESYSSEKTGRGRGSAPGRGAVLCPAGGRDRILDMTADPTNDPVVIRERALSTAVEAKGPLSILGGDYMASQEARVAAKDLGIGRWPFYFGGRGGVLGPVPAEVVHAVFCFFPAEHVHKNWGIARDAAASGPLERIVDRFADLQRVWADAHLSGLAESDAADLADLLAGVARTVETGMSPLAAAWGTMPEPSAPRHRVVHWAHVMREQRGGLHIAAVQMAGLNPLEAILAGSLGEGGAKHFCWPEPYAEPDEATKLFRDQAEEITDELASRAYRGLDERESERLVELLNKGAAAAKS